MNHISIISPLPNSGLFSSLLLCLLMSLKFQEAKFSPSISLKNSLPNLLSKNSSLVEYNGMCSSWHEMLILWWQQFFQFTDICENWAGHFLKKESRQLHNLVFPLPNNYFYKSMYIFRDGQFSIIISVHHVTLLEEKKLINQLILSVCLSTFLLTKFIYFLLSLKNESGQCTIK